MTAVQFNRADEDVYRVSGELSFQSVPLLLKASDKVFHKDTSVTIDLQEVTRADSAGVAMLIEWARNAHEADAKIEFHNMPQQMLEIARVSGVDKLLAL